MLSLLERLSLLEFPLGILPLTELLSAVPYRIWEKSSEAGIIISILQMRMQWWREVAAIGHQTGVRTRAMGVQSLSCLAAVLSWAWFWEQGSQLFTGAVAWTTVAFICASFLAKFSKAVVLKPRAGPHLLNFWFCRCGWGRESAFLMRASLVAQLVKNLPAMQETPVWFLGWEDPLEKG